MKRRKLVLAAMIAAMAVPSLSAMAYDGDILTITADSDGDPFSWDTSTDKLAAMIEDKFGIDFQQSETNYYNNDFTVTQLAAVDGTLPDVFCADILYYTQEITQFIPEELVAEIPEELLDKYPLTKQLLENDAVSRLLRACTTVTTSCRSRTLLTRTSTRQREKVSSFVKTGWRM